VSDWAYVAIAYVVVGGSLAGYALLLARRVAQARRVERDLQAVLESDQQGSEQDSAVWDAPPAP
jgi:cob(I)alamin adenosyltransferase